MKMKEIGEDEPEQKLTAADILDVKMNRYHR